MILYAARVQYVGCAAYVWTATDEPLRLQLNVVCMFGTQEKPLIPLNATLKQAKRGPPCRRCVPHSIGIGCNDHFRGLCGSSEKIRTVIYRRWNVKFWENPGQLIINLLNAFILFSFLC